MQSLLFEILCLWPILALIDGLRAPKKPGWLSPGGVAVAGAGDREGEGGRSSVWYACVPFRARSMLRDPLPLRGKKVEKRSLALSFLAARDRSVVDRRAGIGEGLCIG